MFNSTISNSKPDKNFALILMPFQGIFDKYPFFVSKLLELLLSTNIRVFLREFSRAKLSFVDHSGV